MAIEVYRAALLALRPNAEICFRLGELSAWSGEMAAARERYFMAVELEPDYIEARANLGCLVARRSEPRHNEIEAFDAESEVVKNVPTIWGDRSMPVNPYRSSPGSICLALLITGLITWSSFWQSATAQTRESAIARYFTDDVAMVVTVDASAILASIDKSSDDYQYVLSLLEGDIGTPLSVESWERVQLTVAVTDDFDFQTEMEDLVCIDFQWQTVVDYQAVVEYLGEPWFDEIVQEERADRPFYRYTGDWGGASFAVPDDRRVLMANAARAELAIEGLRDSDSPGGELARQVDLDRQFHLLLDLRRLADGDLRAHFIQEFLRGPFFIPRDVVYEPFLESILFIDVSADSNSREGLLAVIELADEQAAEDLTSLIERGLSAAPDHIDEARRDMEFDELMTPEIKASVEQLLDLCQMLVEHAELGREQNRVTLRVEVMGGFRDAPNIIIAAIAAIARYEQQ